MSSHSDYIDVCLDVHGDYLEKLALLTRRETQVSLCVAEGRSNESIARKLRIQKSTVASHILSAKLKLRVRNRAHLASVITLAWAQKSASSLWSLLASQPQNSN